MHVRTHAPEHAHACDPNRGPTLQSVGPTFFKWPRFGREKGKRKRSLGLAKRPYSGLSGLGIGCHGLLASFRVVILCPSLGRAWPSENSLSFTGTLPSNIHYFSYESEMLSKLKRERDREGEYETASASFRDQARRTRELFWGDCSRRSLTFSVRFVDFPLDSQHFQPLPARPRGHLSLINFGWVGVKAEKGISSS